MVDKHSLDRQQENSSLVQGPKVTILMVEDNPDHAMLARRSLEKYPMWDVDEASSMSEAFQKMHEHAYHVLLVDYCLPDGYGLDLLDWVDNGCVVVMMTGQGSEKVAVEAFKRGAFDYVVKDGMFREVLPEIVEQALARSRALKHEETAFATNNGTAKTAVAYSRNLPILDGYLHTEHLRPLVTRLRRHLSEMKSCVQIVCYNPEQPVTENQLAFLEAALEYCEQIEALVSRLTTGLSTESTD
jgi:CheY-like chemotaxis protein